MLRKIISGLLFSAMAFSVLSSCSQQAVMEKPFVEEEKEVSSYSSKVEGSAFTIYVDAKIEKSGDGSEASPFKTISEAQAKIREMKAAGELPIGGITVLVKDGIYRLTEGFVFTEEDSGTADCPITYVSENEFGAKLMGSVIIPVENFEPINADEKSRLMDTSVADNILRVDLKKYGLTADDWGEYVLSGNHCTAMWYDEFNEAFLSAGIDYRTADWSLFSNKYSEVPMAHESEIFIGDTALVSARWPNKGTFLNTGADDVVDEGDACYGNFMIRNPEGQTVLIRGEIIDRVSKWSSLEDIWIDGYIGISWSGSRNTVEAFDFENETMKLKYNVLYMTGSDGLDRDWFFFNVFDELDSEGEFYLDRENGILYIYKTENFYEEEIKISTLADDIFTFEDVSYLAFKGFNISETRCNGIIGTADNITIDNCKICNLRNGAIQLIGNKITVQNNEIFNVGSFAVKLEGGDMETLTRSDNVVYNNYIHDWARVDTTYKSGIDVQGVGSLVSHNELGNTPHQAIYYRGPYHIIEYNEIYNVLMETADCGAIYSGRNLFSYGSELRYNYIHDIGSKEFNPHGINAHGIYFDDGLSGQKVYGNIIMNTAGYGICISSGRDMFVENNVIINSIKAPLHFGNFTRLTVIDRNPNSGNNLTLVNGIAPYLDNEIWLEAFPEFKGLILFTSDFDGNFDDPMLSANPANGAVRNNLLYLVNDVARTMTHPKYGYSLNDRSKKVELYSDTGSSDVDEFNDISNNPIIFNNFSDFPGWHNGDFTMSKDAEGLKLLSDFTPIPFDEIGRIK